MDELIWMPLVVSAVLNPSPAKVGDRIKITVKAVDRLGGEQPEDWFSGDVWSGEV